MRFTFGTDFHGHINKFEAILKFSLDQGVDLIHLGADILPKGSHILKEQKKFINGFLKDWYAQCKEKGITVLASFGNDDLYTRKPYFKEYATLLDEVPYFRDGYQFYGYPYVTDYPFGLKTACKADYTGWKLQEAYLGDPIDVDQNGFVPIQDIDKYFAEKGTIEEDLKKIKGGPNAIVAIHCPPQGLGLDVCANGRRVGSKSVLEWLKREAPLLILSGHIHESYQISGIWKTQIGNTTVIQPGQDILKTDLVMVDICDQKVIANLVSI